MQGSTRWDLKTLCCFVFRYRHFSKLSLKVNRSFPLVEFSLIGSTACPLNLPMVGHAHSDANAQNNEWHCRYVYAVTFVHAPHPVWSWVSSICLDEEFAETWTVMLPSSGWRQKWTVTLEKLNKLSYIPSSLGLDLCVLKITLDKDRKLTQAWKLWLR